MEEVKTFREVGIMLHEIDNKTDRIEQHVIKTNGRVKFLEKFVWGLAGGLAVLSFIGIGNIKQLIVSASANTINKEDIKEMVSVAVSDALKNTELQEIKTNK